MKSKKIHTKELLEIAVKESVSFAEVCRKIGSPDRGGSYELIKCKILEYDISTEHFLGQAALAGRRNPNFTRKKSKEEILINGYTKRGSHKSLKRALIESNVDYKCFNCGISEWKNEQITLDVDHIDGNWKNCEIQNLRFLCPNCHRQTKTFGGIKKEKQIYYCKCGNEKLKLSKSCKKCSLENRSKIKIDIEQLKIDVWIEPLNKLNKKYNISDRHLFAICEINNIKIPPKGYWVIKNKKSLNINKQDLLKDLSMFPLLYIYSKYDLTKNTLMRYCKENSIDFKSAYKREKRYNQYTGKFRHEDIAQNVEQGTENPCVVES